tara:strand:+ start:1303 stop:1662 length:360 start_codon:yes stop_codon:yes gene_type:complete
MITSRPANKPFAGFYEFPGGKVKKNEFLLEALKRELEEELSLKINFNKLIFLCSYQVTRKRKKIELNFFSINTWDGRIQALENQKVRWIKFSEINNFKMLSSNKKIIDFLNYFLVASKN